MLTVEVRPLSSIKPYAGNPRQNDDAVDAVATSLREFGWRAPIVVDAEGVIICGHTRFKAALKLGLSDAPVHVARDLDPDKVRAFRLADNQTATLSTWDAELLPLELAALQDADFNMGILGFSQDELDKWLIDDSAEGHTDPDETPEPPSDANIVSKPGEIYQLGRHRLACGDATDAAVMKALMAGETADLLVVDPPYGVCYKGGTKDELTIENDNLDAAQLLPFLTAAFKAANAVMKNGCSFYIWHADINATAFREACADAGWRVRQGLVWVKNALVLGRNDYHYKHEPCLYGWSSGAAHQWFSDRKQCTVLEFNKPARNGEHPTMKPVELIAYQIGNSCPKGGLVLDSFGGSGTTMIAAETTGRRACLVELDPKYCDVIRRRYSEFAHGKDEDWIERTPVIHAMHNKDNIAVEPEPALEPALVEA